MASVIILCKTFLKGGAEKQAITLAKLLTENKTKTILINWCGDQIDEANLNYINSSSLRYIGLEGSTLTKFRSFLKIVKSEEISIILSYLTLANFITGITKLFNRKIITIGGIRTDKLPFYKFFFERIVHNHLNDATVFNNYSAKIKFAKRGFRSSKIYVVHNAIHVTDFPDCVHTDDCINLITVARFVGPKDFRTSLHSFKGLTERVSTKKFRYLLAGYGPMESEIRSLTKELGLEGSVEILINPKNIPDLLKASDIYLSTSLFEGLSNSIMEAMVAGLPIVATDVGDNQYLVKHEFNGYLVPCRDINATIQKLELLAKSENLRKEFGRNSYNMVKDEFSEAKLTENYLSLLSRLSR
jgi:glycosyltransferase involved in cell wall biosynthesis